MSKSVEIIEQEIEQFKLDNGGDYGDYYIGITNNLDRRIVELNSNIHEHISSGKYKEGDPYYSEEADSRDDAVLIEIKFQKKGMKGYNPSAKGIKESHFVYSFKIAKEYKEILESEKKKMKNLIDFDNYAKR